MIGLIRREIFQERNGRRRKEGVCDNTDDAHAKRTLAHVLNKRFRHFFSKREGGHYAPMRGLEIRIFDKP